MQFRLLGGVDCHSGGRVVGLGPSRQRSVLAVLLVEANRLVSLDSLADRVWDGRPPLSVRNTVHSYVSRLRKVLSGTGEVVISQQSGGYLLVVEQLAVDMHLFRRLVTDARAAQGERALVLFEHALELWHGEPLAGMNTLWSNEIRDSLERERFATQLDLIDVALRCGHHSGMLPLLSSMVAKHPVDERLSGQLMLALHRNGRQADALNHYRQVRQRLAEDLGVDPSPDLRRLHHQILIADPVLAAPGDRAADSPPELSERHTAILTGQPTARSPAPAPRPAQLPADIASFTGRALELDRLRHAGPNPAAVVISAIDGMAGVGKTALAVHAAHQLADQFPDGQLFVDLHGYAEQTEPVEPAVALDRLLRALGVPDEQIPAGVEDRAALFRTTLAGRRVLLVLDNAASASQVRPVLPGAPGCLVLITSRQRLLELDDAHVLSLDVLPASDAEALFVRTVGRDRLAGAAPEQIAEIVALCGCLPLAIRVAAARLRGHAVWSVARLADRLRDQRYRLAELEAGQRSVTAALSLSYRHLDPEQQRAYRLLGLHPGPAIDAYAAAALMNTSTFQAEWLLDDLHNAHLLTEPTPGHYSFHDLTRAHAGSQHEPEPGRKAALTRLFDLYTYTAAMAMNLAYPHEIRTRPQVAYPATPSPELTPDQAITWLDTQHANLLAIAAHAEPRHRVALSATLHRHLSVRGDYSDAHTLHTNALRAAKASGDRAGEVTALNDLGGIHDAKDEHERAAEHYVAAGVIAREIGDRAGELTALIGLGKFHLLVGRLDEALDYERRAAAVARETGNRGGELAALRVLGDIYRLQGQYEQALESVRQGLAIAREIGNSTDELWALLTVGDIHFDRGTHQDAADCYQQGLDIANRAGNRLGELSALRGLGDIHRLQRGFDPAADYLERSLAIARDIGNRNGQFEALLSLGYTQHAAGDPELALTHHQHALQLARDLNQPHDQARAHEGIASAHDALDREDEAHEHWRQALKIYTNLGLPDAEKICAHLA